MRIRLLLLSVLVSVVIAPQALGQARAQAIHNSPYAEVATVDVYVSGFKALDNISFREASEFIDLPTSFPLQIDVTDADAPDISNPIYTEVIQFADQQTYVLVAVGDPLNRMGNPPFDIVLINPALETAETTGNLSASIFHGVPDAAAVDVLVRGTTTKLADDLAFGTSSATYADLAPGVYPLAISPASDADESLIASYVADLSAFADSAFVLLASGFLSPASGDPGLSLIAAFPDQTVLTLPAVVPIADVRAAANSTAGLALEGTVTRSRGRLTYIQDESAGIAVFQSSGPFRDAVNGGNVAEGDQIVLSGSRSDFSNLQQMSPAAWAVLSRGNSLPPPQTVTLSDVATGGETYESELIQVVDLTIDGAGDTVFVASRTYAITDATDQSGAVSLRTPSASDSDIDGLPVPAGATFEGVLGQFSSSDPAVGYQLTPVNAEDITPQLAQAQFIHNAPGTDADIVDIYMNGNLTLDDFSFRSATAFIDVPGGVSLDFAFAPSTSTSVADAVAVVPGVVFAEGGVFVAAAGGLIGSVKTPFDLFLYDGALASGSMGETDVLLVHGSPDAPAIDLREGSQLLVDSVAYGASSQFTVPEGSYLMDLLVDETGALVNSFAVDLSAAGGEFRTVLVSGFLVPPPSSVGREQTLIVVDAGGGVTLPTIVTDVESTPEVPDEFALRGNYPNPFNPSTNIAFDLPAPAIVGLEIYDVLGRRVMTIAPRPFGSGANQRISVSMDGLPSGIYLYRLTAELGTEKTAASGQMTLLK